MSAGRLHRRLGAVAEEIEELAWHLALGADGPSEEIAEILDGAAEHAGSRGAPESAAALEEQAARLTPASRPGEARERSVRAADYHFRGGEIARSRELIESALAACPAGPARATLLVRLGTIHYHEGDWSLAEKVFRQAAKEAPENPASVCTRGAGARVCPARGRGPARCLPLGANTSLRSARQAADQRLVAHSLATHRPRSSFSRGTERGRICSIRPRRSTSAKDEQPVERRAMLDPFLLQRTRP